VYYSENKKLNCLFINARSIMNNFKLEELKLYIQEYSIDIIGIAETWLTDSVSDSEIQIEHFSIFRKDRGVFKDGRGGGVLLYVKSSLESYACDDLNKFKCESIWCSLKLKHNCELLVGAAYKSPNAANEEIDQLFACIKLAATKQVILMGDFNYPGINWDLLDSDRHGESFLGVIQDSF
jgi:hypothetical protein